MLSLVSVVYSSDSRLLFPCSVNRLCLFNVVFLFFDLLGFTEITIAHGKKSSSNASTVEKRKKKKEFWEKERWNSYLVLGFLSGTITVV